MGNNLNLRAREKNTTGIYPVGATTEVGRALAALRHLTIAVEGRSGSAV